MTQSIKSLDKHLAKSEIFDNRYASLFHHSPISIWEEDFSEVKLYFDRLKKRGIKSVRKYLEQYPEEVLSLAGKIKILDVNDATLKMYQCRSKKDLYQGLTVIFNKESYDVFREELIAFSEGKTEFQSEAINLTFNGEIKHVLLKVVVSKGYEDTLANVFVHIVDISQIKQMAADLKESEEKYRTIVESANDAIFVADTETGIILEVNQKAEELIGIPAAEIVGMHFTQLHAEEEADYHGKRFRDYVRHGRFVSEKLMVCRKNGEKIPVSISTSVIHLRKKQCISAIIRQLPQEVPSEVEGAHINKPRELSHREFEIVKLIAAGLSSREIGDKLCISETTVKTHRIRIMRKLSLHKTAELVRYALHR